MSRTPVVLLIFDGWGLSPNETEGNAVAMANPGQYNTLLKDYPWIPIEASGEPVGLPDGQMGNSEVGHMNMGAGRIVYQELTRIDKAVKDETFFENEILKQPMEHVKKTGGTLHLMGLVSDGGVHSHITHLLALIDMAKEQGVEKVKVHAFLDGRDVPPKSAETYLRAVEETLMDDGYDQIATVSGRYYAMDRDNRWERVQKAYDTLVSAQGDRQPLSLNALNSSYNEGVNDEFVLPVVTDFTYDGMKDGDGVIFINFRPDRARQLTRALTDPDFAGFERSKVLQNLCFVCMSPYDETFNLPIAFPKQRLDRILAEIVSENGIKQFHTAETEKYAHVTFFFNGGREEPFPGEDRTLIPSPQVATYDLQPEMSVRLVTDAMVDAIESGQYGLIVANFANPDMVGHTGKLPAAIEAVNAVDESLHRVVEAVLKAEGTLLLTADHGNVEKMIDEDGGEHTAHTTAPVPLVLVSANRNLALDTTQTFGLSSIAPTLLDLMGLPIPPEMTSPTALAPSKVSV